MTIRSLLKQLVPPAFRPLLARLLGPLWALPRCCSIFLMRRIKDGVPHVYYGYAHIPRKTEHARGGIIKSQILQDLFPNSPSLFNLLYLVSSRIPYGAVQVAGAARMKGAHLVWNQNGVAYPAWHGPGWKAVNAPLATLLHAADYVFYQSEFCRRSADRYLGVRKGPWEILYNPVDTDTFTPAVSDPDPRHLVLLLGGNQYQFYRLSTAFHVLAEVLRHRSDAKLIVTGRLCWLADEAKAARIAVRLASELGVQERVHFLGPYSQRDAPDIFRQAHLMLHTKYNDPCPGAVIEAMACGLPIVYSDSGGVPELVGKEAGRGIPVEMNWDKDLPPDPKAMAAAVLDVAEHREELSAAARRRAKEQFDIRPWLQRHREVFEGLVQ